MFSNDDIIRMAGGVTYERGRQLYDADYVLDMDVQTEGDYDVIVASVRGSGTKVYETDLLILYAKPESWRNATANARPSAAMTASASTASQSGCSTGRRKDMRKRRMGS